MSITNLANRMKSYESHETLRRSMRRLPLCVRLDGRAFHTFTKGLERPFDAGFAKAMIETTKYLVSETCAKIGYTQSDEITLVFWEEGFDRQPLFGGKLFKLTSVLASMTTAKFNSMIPEHMPSKVSELATFDARIFQVPTLEEAANLVLWRWFDARKNSVSMAAQAFFTPKQLHGKSTVERLEMLKTKGVEWDRDYPDHFKSGSFIRRVGVMRELTEAELDRIPAPHRPTGPIKKTDVVVVRMPPLVEIKNRVEVLIFGEEPQLARSADQIRLNYESNFWITCP